MKKDEIVTIYQDYLTKQRIEGQAKLIRRIKSTRDSETAENWKVKFTSDGFVCERMVSLN